MEPGEFIDKWRHAQTTERAAAQEHFIDLCRVLELPTPMEADPRRESYAFEKRVTKPDGRTGYADVWKRNCFAWEYKRDRRNLVAAYSQLKDYADTLENPPLLIVSDMREIRIHTNFTNTVAETIVIRLPDINSVEARQALRWAFTDPGRLRPTETREGVTTKAAAAFGRIAQKLRNLGYEPRRVAHFLNKIVFCLFVEDIELLPKRVFADILEEGVKRPQEFERMLRDLFRAMREDHGGFGAVSIPWFNGGLFDDDDVLPLDGLEIRDLADAARLDWSKIEPSIFGTLFEKGLNPERRREMAGLFDTAGEPEEEPPGATLLQLLDSPVADRGVGIHYTDRETIMKLIEPVVLRPLAAEWRGIKAKIADRRAARDRARSDAVRTRAENEARQLYMDFRQRLGRFRVLDPACGSGNFLYLALTHLKDFDRAVEQEGRAMGLPADDQRVTPESVLGIEINPYAAELARVTIWIGELQWQLGKGFGIKRRPILGQLRGIECRDALLANGAEAKWPEANVVVGNPPFLGTKRMYEALGVDYAKKLRSVYADRLSPFSDLVCWWFEKAGRLVEGGKLDRAGLVATNSIRGGKNRLVLDRIVSSCAIYDAWDDERWVIDGAAVRVSLICFARSDEPVAATSHLDGRHVSLIHSDLTAQTLDGDGVDLTKASRLTENRGTAFVGTVKAGAFDVPGREARELLQLPSNPNGRPNSDVIRPWANGLDVVRRPQDKWIIDFGTNMSEAEAALYERPFKIVVERVKPARAKVRRARYRDFWWLEAEPCAGMRAALQYHTRFIVTPALAKHRLFFWMDSAIQPDHQLIGIARDDDTTFGILHSRFHDLWALRMGTSLEDRPRYTPSTIFETFPFPEGLTPDIPAADYADDPRAQAIAAAAVRLDELRGNWLNPPDLVKREPEVVPGYPDRILPRGEKAAKDLKKRTLTNLYNERPQWLDDAHRALDEAVAAAYGWPADLSDDEILKRLLDLNLARAADQER